MASTPTSSATSGATITSAERAKILDALEFLRMRVEAIEVRNPCARCLHFDSETQHCEAHNDAVPDDWLAVGCEKWEDDIPF